VPILAGVLAAVALLVGGTLLAVWAREALQARPAPEAPVAEAPRAEAVPEAIGPFEVGMIMKAGWMPVFPERLAEHLGNTGADVTLEIMSTTYETEMLAMTENYVVRGFDVIIVQGMDPAGIVAQKVAELTSAAGIQLLLLGTDPVYTQEGNDLMHTYENTVYIDADPRTLASQVANSLIEAEKNGDDAISYLFLHSEDLGTVSDALAGMLPEELEKIGSNAALLEEVPGAVDYLTLEDTILRHRDEIEAIVCTDGEIMSAAIEACASLGIDIKKDLQIIVLADCDTLPELYSSEYIGGYVTYGPKLLAEHVSFALEIIFEGAGIGGWYVPEGMDICY
jgi:ABC-type sugar transport system substrate-binding protein